MEAPTNQIFEILETVLGEAPPGLEFMYVILGGLLLVFVFHLLEHIFEIVFGKFF